MENATNQGEKQVSSVKEANVEVLFSEERQEIGAAFNRHMSYINIYPLNDISSQSIIEKEAVEDAHYNDFYIYLKNTMPSNPLLKLLEANKKGKLKNLKNEILKIKKNKSDSSIYEKVIKSFEDSPVKPLFDYIDEIIKAGEIENESPKQITLFDKNGKETEYYSQPVFKHPIRSSIVICSKIINILRNLHVEAQHFIFDERIHQFISSQDLQQLSSSIPSEVKNNYIQELKASENKSYYIKALLIEGDEKSIIDYLANKFSRFEIELNSNLLKELIKHNFVEAINYCLLQFNYNDLSSQHYVHLYTLTIEAFSTNVPSVISLFMQPFIWQNFSNERKMELIELLVLKSSKETINQLLITVPDIVQIIVDYNHLAMDSKDLKNPDKLESNSSKLTAFHEAIMIKLIDELKDPHEIKVLGAAEFYSILHQARYFSHEVKASVFRQKFNKIKTYIAQLMNLKDAKHGIKFPNHQLEALNILLKIQEEQVNKDANPPVSMSESKDASPSDVISTIENNNDNDNDDDNNSYGEKITSIDEANQNAVYFGFNNDEEIEAFQREYNEVETLLHPGPLRFGSLTPVIQEEHPAAIIEEAAQDDIKPKIEASEVLEKIIRTLEENQTTKQDDTLSIEPESEYSEQDEVEIDSWSDNSSENNLLNIDIPYSQFPATGITLHFPTGLYIDYYTKQATQTYSNFFFSPRWYQNENKLYYFVEMYTVMGYSPRVIIDMDDFSEAQLSPDEISSLSLVASYSENNHEIRHFPTRNVFFVATFNVDNDVWFTYEINPFTLELVDLTDWNHHISSAEDDSEGYTENGEDFSLNGRFDNPDITGIENNNLSLDGFDQTFQNQNLSLVQEQSISEREIKPLLTKISNNENITKIYDPFEEYKLYVQEIENNIEKRYSVELNLNDHSNILEEPMAESGKIFIADFINEFLGIAI